MDTAKITPSLGWRLGVCGVIAITLVCLDQIVKVFVRYALMGGGLVTVIPGVLGFRFCANTGAAFSIGEGHGLLFVVLAVVVVGSIIWYLAKTPQVSRVEVVGLSLVMGGAVGNAIDRVLHGYVTDFIATLFINFPVFNIADIGITVGVALAFVGFMFLSPAVKVDATEELNRRDEARAARKSAKKSAKGGR